MKASELKIYLAEYTLWLERHYYVDSDVWQEYPKAVDAFVDAVQTSRSDEYYQATRALLRER